MDHQCADPCNQQGNPERYPGGAKNAADPVWVVHGAGASDEARGEDDLEGRLRQDEGGFVDHVDAGAEDDGDDRAEDRQHNHGDQSPFAVQQPSHRLAGNVADGIAQGVAAMLERSIAGRFRNSIPRPFGDDCSHVIKPARGPAAGKLAASPGEVPSRTGERAAPAAGGDIETIAQSFTEGTLFLPDLLHIGYRQVFEPELDETKKDEVGEEDRQRVTDDDALHPRCQQAQRGQQAGEPRRQEDEGHVEAQWEAVFGVFGEIYLVLVHGVSNSNLSRVNSLPHGFPGPI